ARVRAREASGRPGARRRSAARECRGWLLACARRGGGAAMSTPTGTTHDLGYKRYVGSRRSTATRWRVIMRNQIAVGWKKWWRYKLSLVLAILVLFIAGAIMYFMSDQRMKMIDRGGFSMMIIDGTVPAAVAFFCRFPAFILSLTLGAMVVAGDTQTG